MRVNPPFPYWTVDPATGLLLPGNTFDWNGLRFIGGVCVGPGTSSVNGGSFTDVVGTPVGSPIQFRRGLAANLPTLRNGEPGWAQDTKTFYVGDPGGNPIAIGGTPTITVALTGDVTGSASGAGTVTVPTTLAANTFPKIVASSGPVDPVNQSASIASLTAYPVPAGHNIEFSVGGYIKAITNVGSTLSIQVGWTDENNQAQTKTFTSFAAGATGDNTFSDAVLNAKAGTTITVSTTAVVVTLTYDVGSHIIQIRNTT